MKNPNNDEKEQIPMRRQIVSCYVLVTAIVLLTQVLNARFDESVQQRASNIPKSVPKQPNHDSAYPSYFIYEDSLQLQHTTIVPTFDTPMPHDKNVIWCASFQMAWDRLAKDVLHGPVELTNSPESVPRLNAGTIENSDLPEDGYLAMAGLCRDGITQKILDEMQRRFHRQPRFDLTDPDYVLVTYAYLEANVPFTLPYCNGRLSFRDNAGAKTAVRSFGTRHAGELKERLNKQFRILHLEYDEHLQPDEFVIDPCHDSQPNQIIFARIQPAPTLEKTWQRVEKLTAKSARGSTRDKPYSTDELLVPEMAWDITHAFQELQDKVLLNKGFDGLFIAKALQAIRFRLDRSGATLQSEGVMALALSDDEPRMFAFDRPFFIFVKKRDGKKPFFAMYVDNAELLQKWKAEE